MNNNDKNNETVSVTNSAAAIRNFASCMLFCMIGTSWFVKLFHVRITVLH